MLRDRKMLSEEGLVVVVATINLGEKNILAGPDILSRGFVYMRESGELISEAQRRVFRMIVNTFNANDKVTENQVREAIIDGLQDFLFEKTERRPMILPMIIQSTE